MRDHQGFTLPTTIITILVITTLLIVLILVKLFEANIHAKNDVEFTEYLNLRSAICSSMSDQQNSSKIKKYYFDNDTVSVKIEKGIIANNFYANCNSYAYSLSAKTMVLPPEYFSNALTISKEKPNLVEAGNINISGTFLLQNKNITRRNIPGVSTYHKFIDKTSIRTIENIPHKLFKDLAFNFSDSLLYKNATVLKGDCSFKDITTNLTDTIKIIGNLTIDYESFDKPLPFIYVSGKVIIKNCKNLQIKNISADSTISILNCENFSNCNFYSSNKINFKSCEQFKNVSAIAKNNISISESIFNYPSFVSVLSDTLMKNPKSLELINSKFSGTLSLFSEYPVGKDNSHIFIDKSSFVRGYIYSESKSELSGILIGSMYTYQTRKFLKPTEYINWLADLNINRFDLGQEYLFPALLNQTKKSIIIQEQLVKKH